MFRCRVSRQSKSCDMSSDQPDEQIVERSMCCASISKWENSSVEQCPLSLFPPVRYYILSISGTPHWILNPSLPGHSSLLVSCTSCSCHGYFWFSTHTTNTSAWRGEVRFGWEGWGYRWWDHRCSPFNSSSLVYRLMDFLGNRRCFLRWPQPWYLTSWAW